MKRIPIYQVSAFGRGPFTGNLAAVCPLEEWIPDATMQGIAAENNLSDTAFVVARADGDFDLRWFTPTVEVDLCGHATLASGHVTLNLLDSGRERVAFHTRSGKLTVARRGELLALDLPAKRAVEVDNSELMGKLAKALVTRPVKLLDAGLPVALFDDERQIGGINPEFGLIVSSGLKWLSVTAPTADTRTDFVSRYFAPGSGINEDPETGSAQGWFTPYWAHRLGKQSLSARQVSKRGGWLQCQLHGERATVADRVEDNLAGEIVVG